MNIDELTTKGFVEVDYPADIRLYVNEAVASWRRFCELSQATKLELSNNDRVYDFGYMLRRDKGETADSKELFHVSRTQIALLRERASRISDERALIFINAIDTLLHSISTLVQDFAHQVETKYGILNFESDTMRAIDNWTFRYVHYFGGEMLANPHCDRGGFTFHLYESHTGGEYLARDGKWMPWPISTSSTMIFPSMMLQHRSRGLLKALWHRVLSTPETKTNGRFALIGFIDFEHSYMYDYKAKRLQDFPPGFNYDLPFPEFAKMFTPS